MDHSDWPRLHIVGSQDRFSVRRVWCIGRNYVDHAKEMGESGQKPPLVFAKNPAGLIPVAEGQMGEMSFPSETQDLHHEVELVLAIGESGVIIGTAVGLDMTRRDLQRAMKERRGPWTVAKDFAGSAPVGPITLGPPAKAGSITLRVDGEVRQSGDIALMIWGPDALVERVNGLCPLKAGDLIFTGTPAGVGPVVVGQNMEAQIDGLETLRVQMVRGP